MRTTPEQRAIIRKELRAYGPGDDLLDDLDDALEQAAHWHERTLQAEAEVAFLRAVAEAAKGVAAWTMHADQSTRSGTLGTLRAALRAWEERER